MATTPYNGAGADFDLSQFSQIFFEEAGENLDQMEQMLLDLDVEAADDEILNGIFRCAHSIKGGSATFGFSDVAELTHKMESLLDRLRRHELKIVPQMVDVLLESADVSRSLLALHQSGGQGETVATQGLVARISALTEGAQMAAPAPVASPVLPPPPALPHSATALPSATVVCARALELHIGPLAQLTQADAIKELFRDIPDLGTIEDLPDARPGMRRFAVQTTSSDGDLLDLLVFHVAKEQVQIVAAAPVCARAPAPAPAPAPTPTPVPVPVAPVPAATTTAVPARAAREGRVGSQTSMESTTIRVDVKKVDQLINLVGELVITQAVLAQNSRDLDTTVHQPLLLGLADLARSTRDLQESVMSIRMIPMSAVFNRFPRMLRDLAGKLGKKVDFVTQGEATELDKGLIEKITDPLTHLVRNSCDHGIEMPQQRLAAGKPEHGTLTLAASHRGGSIVIEVRDDGRGMSREKIVRKARERGMDVSDSMSDGEVWGLILAPGFSTAEVVTDVSGRGVGMDVVKRNIMALGGSVEIDAVEGKGMCVSVHLPLTLAIMDGMSVGVGREVYILPLSSVVESFQVDTRDVNTVAQGTQLVKVRDEYMPVLALERLFGVPPGSNAAASEPSYNIMVVVEAEGSRIALLVHELLGQQQVVVKNLETNYRKVPDVSGATILGDGRVALILDTAALVRRARH